MTQPDFIPELSHQISCVCGSSFTAKNTTPIITESESPYYVVIGKWLDQHADCPEMGMTGHDHDEPELAGLDPEELEHAVRMASQGKPADYRVDPGD